MGAALPYTLSCPVRGVRKKAASMAPARAIITIHVNDGGVSQTKCSGIPVFTIDRLLDVATKKLGLQKAARKLYLKDDGTTVTEARQLQNGSEIVVSTGESFVKTKASKAQRVQRKQPNAPGPSKPPPKVVEGAKVRLQTKAAARILCSELGLTVEDTVVDCCGGFDGAVAAALLECGCRMQHTNDISIKSYASSHEDATEAAFWQREDVCHCSWVVSRPPEWLAPEILPLAL